MPARAIVRIQGYGRSQAVVAQFILRLEQTGLFDDVVLVKTNREPFLDDHAMSFQVECQLRATPLDAGGDAPNKPGIKPSVRRRTLADVDAAGSLPATPAILQTPKCP